jgi:hypothetical protein
MSFDRESAKVIDFPLRGEWRALHTPAAGVPSHGTDYFGQRYAFDFVRMDEEGTRYQPGSILRHIIGGVPAHTFFGWDQPVYSAFDGRVILTGDGWADRADVSVLKEHARAFFARVDVRPDDFRPLTGNFALVEGVDGVALYAHFKCGSVRVRPGDIVVSGTQLGTVGNSGNSGMPHLHFHLMDGADPLTANGLPVAFRRYERFIRGAWESVECGLPARWERIRFVDPLDRRNPRSSA